MRCHSASAFAVWPSTTASHQPPVWISMTGARNLAAISICCGSAEMNSDTRMPASFSRAMNGASALCWPTTSSPPSVVSSSRRSGTRHTAWGFVASDIRSMSSVAAISKFSGFEISAFRRAISSSRMCRRSSRKCAVMPSAPASIATSAARTGSGRIPALALRSVATWSTLTPRRSGGGATLAIFRQTLQALILRSGHRPRLEGSEQYGLMVRDARKSALLTMRKSYLPVDAFDPCDDGFGAQLVDNSAQMLQVIDLKIDRELGEIRRAPAHADIVDIAVVLGDHGRHLGKAARFVDIVDPDPGRKPLRGGFIDIPAHVEPAFGFLFKILQRRRLDRVDGHALARRHDAHDAVARHRAAIRRELDRQIGIDAA